MPNVFQRSDSMAYFNDYSFLFQDSSQQMTNNYSWLSEYSNIKSGTYYKTLKAYYEKVVDADEDSKTSKKDKEADKTKDKAETKVLSESDKVLNRIQVDAEELSKAADTLVTRGTDSLFRQKDIETKAEDGTVTTQKGYDTKAIYNAVKKFADGYNSLLHAASDADSQTLLNQSLQMISQTSANKSALESVGITINKDDTLSVNKDTFMSANVEDVKALFNGTTSYAYKVGTRAELLQARASYEMNSSKNYTSNGTYDNGFSTGNLLDSLF